MKTLNIKAFTVIETIITVVILGLMAAFVVPKLNAPSEYVISGEAKSVLGTVLGAQQRFALDNAGNFATNVNQLDVVIPVSTNFNNLTVANNAAGVASCARIAGTHTFTISSTGVITCGPAGNATCAQIKCNRNGIQQCN